MATSLAAQLEADSIEHWFHVNSPLDNWGVYTVLTDGLITAKQEHRVALVVHDHERAAAALAEVRDLTLLCAAAAEGLALQRARFISGGEYWPLDGLPLSGRADYRVWLGQHVPIRIGMGPGQVSQIPSKMEHLTTRE